MPHDNKDKALFKQVEFFLCMQHTAQIIVLFKIFTMDIIYLPSCIIMYRGTTSKRKSLANI